MRLSSIMQIGKEYLLLGVIGVMVLGLLFAAGYFLIYRRLMKGNKKLNLRTLLLTALLLIYFIVVLGVTLGIRGSGYTGKPNLHLFSSYREAWNGFSRIEWQNLILNILLFVPLGFLLPLLHQRCRRFWVTYGLGLLVTILIEITQYLSKRGIFEIDDILNNTVGTMIGFGIVSLLLAWCIGRTKQSRVSKPFAYRTGALAALQLPLVLTVTAFVIVFSLYSAKELGNMPIAYAVRQNMSKLTVTSNMVPDPARRQAYVYKAVMGTQSDTLRTANDFLAYFDTSVEEDMIYAYENTVVYRSKDDNYTIWVDYKGLTYDFHEFSSDEKDGEAGLDMAQVESVLGQYGIEIPQGAEFIEYEDGNYRFEVTMADMGDYFLDGWISCRIAGGAAAELDNRLVRLEPYKEYELISEQEAYEQILQGKFKLYGEVTSIAFDAVDLEYSPDSKGYYQPVYVFSGSQADSGNSEVEAGVSIPALP